MVMNFTHIFTFHVYKQLGLFYLFLQASIRLKVLTFAEIITISDFSSANHYLCCQSNINKIIVQITPNPM